MKKKVNILLILVVLSIWGVVIFRSVNNFFSSKNNNSIAVNTTDFALKKIEKDSFDLEPLKRNPFTNRMALVSNPINQSQNKIVIKRNLTPIVKKSIFKIKQEPKASITTYNTYKFVGTIKNQSQGEMVILRINEEIKRLFLNVKQNDLLVKKIYKDSILLITNGEKIMVKR